MSNNRNFLRRRRAEAVSNRGPSAYQPNALPLGQTGSPDQLTYPLLNDDRLTGPPLLHDDGGGRWAWSVDHVGGGRGRGLLRVGHRRRKTLHDHVVFWRGNGASDLHHLVLGWVSLWVALRVALRVALWVALRVWLWVALRVTRITCIDTNQGFVRGFWGG